MAEKRDIQLISAINSALSGKFGSVGYKKVPTSNVNDMSQAIVKSIYTLDVKTSGLRINISSGKSCGSPTRPIDFTFDQCVHLPYLDTSNSTPAPTSYATISPTKGGYILNTFDKADCSNPGSPTVLLKSPSLNQCVRIPPSLIPGSYTATPLHSIQQNTK